MPPQLKKVYSHTCTYPDNESITQKSHSDLPFFPLVGKLDVSSPLSLTLKPNNNN